MLILNPRQVTFGETPLANIGAISIDRAAARTIEEFGEHGPYAEFVDVPEQRIRIRLVQDVVGDDALPQPIPGDEGELAFTTAPAGHARTRRFAISAVVLAVEHEISLKRGSVRTITLAAVSSDGALDPISITSL